ncbi:MULTISPECIES: NAD(P)H-dependent glycerol-3-phosphate dehydrogenase [unclassified Saccharibacter]|uniref:NAD(P)H-dependent glycerol-3-phosphate dehydrogenase n=1 Tax=unclassified Saccharibacter TaxID=2648722 RepID=UPI00132198FE|nr:MULTISPECIES: NAD(P)H-dependent glycerol-3-phosphate dehydrogenase [unclassified Saccharibacter]MXV36199.1 NAD(P)H-dependent glycerol-3-phosphate dehydrogenase [Saccharibacter sp. EH611]MXV57059.1 NAD(P)H-dependent glycerol-3-phosphate dehydrogenase [Saccharibacter sp. EH70]MXV66581.1 NAD(P)H-dependent glycerol-3-phosphate dehydrogenase [Saccharibacter sp. EH60]
MTRLPHIAVIGAGAWGTALACSAAQIANVSLWTRSPVAPDTRSMPRLPDVRLPERVSVTNTLPHEADVILLVVPTQALRDTSLALEKNLPAHVPVITCCKGMEQGTFALPLEVLAQTMPDHPAAVLSGPNFAIEIAKGLPAAATLAASDLSFAQDLAKRLTTPTLRLYASNDPFGVQMAGAAKNVIAIGAGITVGAEMGENARAALITRSLAELGRLIETMGGQARTIYGLAGMGDLILTATGPGSRNYSLGIALGRGESLDSILAQRSTVSEGVLTAPTLQKLGQRHGIETPIINTITRLLSGELTPERARDELLDRPPALE